MERRFVGSGNDSFQCERCGRAVPPLRSGGYRNHCPFCLWSKHVDCCPGDRREDCGGMMEPAGLDQSAKKGFIIIHRCTRCGMRTRNKAALVDPVPDSWDALVALSQKAASGGAPEDARV